jgi:hypothetical protein
VASCSALAAVVLLPPSPVEVAPLLASPARVQRALGVLGPAAFVAAVPLQEQLVVQPA